MSNKKNKLYKWFYQVCEKIDDNYINSIDNIVKYAQKTNLEFTLATYTHDNTSDKFELLDEDFDSIIKLILKNKFEKVKKFKNYINRFVIYLKPYFDLSENINTPIGFKIMIHINSVTYYFDKKTKEQDTCVIQ